MDEIYNELKSLIEVAIPQFKRKNSVLIQKDIQPENNSGEVIYINGGETPAEIIRQASTAQVNHTITIKYFNFINRNSYTRSQSVLDSMTTLLLANQRGTNWYFLNFTTQNEVDSEIEQDYKGFQVNITIHTCRSL